MIKFILIAAAFVIPSLSHAWAWVKTMDCNNGAAVIDRQVAGLHGTFYQLVIRDPGVVAYFRQMDAQPVALLNEKGEMVIPMRPSAGSTQPNDYTGDWDAYQSNGRVFYIKPAGNGLLVEAFATSQPTGGTYEKQGKITDWFFESCHE